MAAEALELVELDRELEGDRIEPGIRGCAVARRRRRGAAFGSLPQLEALGGARGDDFVVRV